VINLELAKLWINDQEVQAEARFETFNPATGEPIAEVCAAGPDEVRAAVEAERAAFPAWSALSVKERCRYLLAARKVLIAGIDDVVALITREQGKPNVEALTSEVSSVIDMLAYYAEHTPQFLAPEEVTFHQPHLMGRRGQVLREPLGVVGIISPWNMPFLLPMISVITALAAGNTVVLKPSEFTPLIGLKIAELFHKVGLPSGVLNVIPGDGRAGAALVSAPDVARIAFTGSVATGKRVAAACAELLRSSTLELGGIGPLIVLDDVDPEVAAAGAVWTRFTNCGQVCLSAERVYVLEAIAELFMAKVTEIVQSLQVGPGTDPNVDVGPLINENQLSVAEQHVADAIAKGAQVLAGGKRLSDKGPLFYAPTVLADVDHSMAVMNEESFGPVMAIMVAKDEAEALRYANRLRVGLSATIWTGDRERGEALARKLEMGMVWVNDSIVYVGAPQMPYGGVKESGWGRNLSHHGLHEMTNVKTIVSTDSQEQMWWYPYNEQKLMITKMYVEMNLEAFQ